MQIFLKEIKLLHVQNIEMLLSLNTFKNTQNSKRNLHWAFLSSFFNKKICNKSSKFTSIFLHVQSYIACNMP